VKGRRAGKEGSLTPKERDELRKQIDARVRARLSERKRAAARARGDMRDK